MDAIYKSTIWTVTVLAIIINNNFLVHSQYAGPRFRNSTRAPVVLRGDQPPPPDTDFEPGYDGNLPVLDLLSFRQIRNKGPYHPHRPHPCEKSSCYPQTGNLLIGREHQLYASSTCGLDGPKRYCIVSHLEDRKKCFFCDSRETAYPKPETNHNISNIVYRVYPGTKQKSWWQSENGKENVYIQLDLEAEFHFTHIIITFKTFRPAAMLIERSYDFKKTWQVYRYFAYNCADSFPGVTTEEARNLTDVICESKYSKVAPSTHGEIIYRVLVPHVRIDNPYSHEVQTLMKVTNLRINFTRLHTLGDDLLDRREEIQEKYYYAITDMVVRGSCSCYGHANSCLPLPGVVPKVDVVHGRCECTHNTKGRNCEKCEDFYNDLPWSPAVGKNTNACKRCNCNNHATSCHFDPAVYEASGRVSGGVCDGCKHNTMGPNCEQCKSFYYRDPSKDIQDPEVCRPCDCDPHGSLDSGICDSNTDPYNNLIAGACHCKTYVEGRRCDNCKNGYWNFTAENPDGCDACSCNIMGTIDNQGCNVYNGECTCKRYVINRNCDQCMDEYYGLSEKRDGCEPCDCDPGGSIDNFCDVQTGQCNCRDHMTGRNCSTPKQQHFTASLDFLSYEAELSKSSPNCQVVIREPYRDGRDDTWTGTGGVKSFEGSTLEFALNNIVKSSDYYIEIRYESPTENWDDVVLTLIRPEGAPQGYCEGVPIEDTKRISLEANKRRYIVVPHFCLEENLPYKVRLEFRRAKYDRESPSASVLIDSIVLIPRIESIPFYHGSAPAEARHREFEMNRCSQIYLEQRRGPIPEICKQHYNSISAFIFNGALSCQCDPTGSVSKLCDEHGGFCSCKPNVVGRRCDRCAPGTYGFGPEGCIACDCNSIGSKDNFCNSTTGQCDCRTNTYGRQCDQCRTGFWNFPNCQRCDCNGHADTCDSRTGACIECRDNTQGHTCDHCVDKFYGDPRLNVDIPCRPCPCPGIPGSGHSYANRCSLDIYTKDVVCECQEGYSGARCDVCADNYYGNPEVPGGVCQPCDCNSKINLLLPGNCDPKTGQCKQCLYDTTGDHCEICKAGYFRNFDSDICAECVCHPLGTNIMAGFCDHNTGQCPCFPNVIGKECDQCEKNHWKIASGSGCEPCNCDPVGSLNPQCNLYDGQCFCKANYGGRQCNECKANYWGNPKLNECHECQCDLYGSATMQCNRKTGACDCREGIGGYNCDKCARGYIGTAPTCLRCGECFDNWERILNEQKNYTDVEIERGKDIKKVGATGAYTKEFDEMQGKLDDVERLLNSTEKIDLKMIDEKSNELRKKINDLKDGQLQELSDSLVNATQGNQLGTINLNKIENKLNLLKNKTKQLEQDRTLLQEENVQGALDLIQQWNEQAARAVQKAVNSQKQIDNYVDLQCKAARNLIEKTNEAFEAEHKNDEMALSQIKENVDNITRSMPELNNLVCDRYGDPCDSLCGGAGCGVCGEAVTCENGAKQQAEMALELSTKTEEILKKTEGKANDFIRNVSLVTTGAAKQNAEKAYDEAKATFNQSEQLLNNVTNYKKEIHEFLNQNISKPEDIKRIAEDILKLNIELDPNKIKELAEKITNAVQLVTNIKPIIEETKEDLERVKKLKQDADDAKDKVLDIKKTTVNVIEALGNSSLEQQKADKAIKGISSDVDKVRNILSEIESKTNIAETQINATANQISDLNNKIKLLKLNVTLNEQAASKFNNESVAINDEANETYEKLKTLSTQFNKTKDELDGTLNKVKSSELKAHELVNRAAMLTANITKMDDDINKMKLIPDSDIEKLESEINVLMGRMTEYNLQIQKKSDNYKTCT